jgi:hypothetical protein
MMETPVAFAARATPARGLGFPPEDAVAEIVNLNKARKARARAEAKTAAAANRVKFGRTKADRDLAAAREDKARQELDAKRRDDE